MKKWIVLSVKLLVLLIILMSISLFNTCIADVVPIDHFNYEDSKDLRRKQALLNEDVTKALDAYNVKKLNTEDKKSYKKEFKKLLNECIVLKKEVKKQYDITSQKDAKAEEQYQNRTNENLRKTDFSSSFGYLDYSLKELNSDEKKFKQILSQLGEKNINSFNEQKMSSNIVFMAVSTGFILLMLVLLSFTVLKHIKVIAKQDK